jgi:hypothetical protein
MRYSVALATAWLLAVAPFLPAAHAEYGGLLVTPQFGANQPLIVEVRNLSKLALSLKTATVRFAGPAAAPPCIIQLPTPITIAPVGVIVLKLMEFDEVTKCMQQVHHNQFRRLTAPHLLTETDLQRPDAPRRRSARTRLQPVEVTFDLEVSTKPATVSMQWRLPYQ